MTAKEWWIGGGILATVLGVPLLTVALLAWMGTAHGWGLAALVLFITAANITAGSLVTLVFALRKPYVEAQRAKRWGEG